MLRTRFWMVVATVVLTLGPLLGTAGYGLYLRSGWYAGLMARRASAFLRAPVRIGGIVPLDAASQGLRDVEVWLPGEFSPIFTCKMAVVRLVDSKNIELELRDGRVEARTDEWDRGTLGQLLATAFGHDFGQIKLRSVRLENMELVARRGRAAVWASGASGQVDLSGQTGRADLVCEGLNGVTASEPVRIHCEFEPGEKPLVRELSLSVRRLGMEAFEPVKSRGAGRGNGGAGTTTASLKQDPRTTADSVSGIRGQPPAAPGASTTTPAEAGTQDRSLSDHGNSLAAPGTPSATTASGTTTGDREQATGDSQEQQATMPTTVAGERAPQSQAGAGWLTGKIVYRQKSREGLAGVVELSGNLAEVNLAAVTQAMGKGRLSGIVNGTLDKAVLEDGEIASVTGRLRIEDLDLKGVLGLAGLPAAAGMATVDLHEIRYEGGTLRAMLAEANVRDLNLEPLLRPLRVGTVTGRLNATLQKLKIVDGRVEEIAGEARMAAPAGGAGTIDRSILEAAVQKMCDVTLPPILPAKVVYADLGVRFHSEEDQLYVEGVAGPEGKFVLVAEVGSVPIPVVPAPAGPIGMGQLQTQAREQMERLGRWVMGWVRE